MQEGTFSVRLISADSYQARPLAQLDPTFSEFRGSEIKHVPIIRVFGTTPQGEKTCLHVHGVFPYLCVPYTGEEDPRILGYRLAASLDAAINVSLGSAKSTVQHVYSVQLVSGTPFYGYHRKKHQFFKIYLYNPAMTKRAADLLQNGSVLNQSLQPHEAHINYILQFMIDYNIYGMSFVNLRCVKYRRLSQNLADLASSGQSAILENSEIMYLPNEIERQSTCELETDGLATDILNRLDIGNNLELNPGLAAIWEEERARRAQAGFEGDDSQLVNPKSPARPTFGPTDSDIYQEQRLARRLLIVSQSEESTLSRTPENSIAYAAELPEGQHLLDSSCVPNISIQRTESFGEVHPPGGLSLSDSLSIPQTPNSITSECSILGSEDMALIDMLADLAEDHEKARESVDADSLLGSQISTLLNLDEEEKLDEEDIADLNLTSLQLDTPSCLEATIFGLENNVQTDEIQISPFPSSYEVSCSPTDVLKKQGEATGSDSDSKSLQIPQYDGAGDVSPTLLHRKHENESEGGNNAKDGLPEYEGTCEIIVESNKKCKKVDVSGAAVASKLTKTLVECPNKKNSLLEGNGSWEKDQNEICDGIWSPDLAISIQDEEYRDYESLDRLLDIRNDFSGDLHEIESSLEMDALLSSNCNEKEEEDEIIEAPPPPPLEAILNGDPCFNESAELEKSADVKELHEQYVSLLDNALLSDSLENSRIESDLDESPPSVFPETQFSVIEKSCEISPIPKSPSASPTPDAPLSTLDDLTDGSLMSGFRGFSAVHPEEKHGQFEEWNDSARPSFPLLSEDREVHCSNLERASDEIPPTIDFTYPLDQSNRSDPDIPVVLPAIPPAIPPIVPPAILPIVPPAITPVVPPAITPVVPSVQEEEKSSKQEENRVAVSFYCSEKSNDRTKKTAHRHCSFTKHNKINPRKQTFASNQLWVLHKRRRGTMFHPPFVTWAKLCANKNCRIPVVLLKKIEHQSEDDLRRSGEPRVEVIDNKERKLQGSGRKKVGRVARAAGMGLPGIPGIMKDRERGTTLNVVNGRKRNKKLAARLSMSPTRKENSCDTMNPSSSEITDSPSSSTTTFDETESEEAYNTCLEKSREKLPENECMALDLLAKEAKSEATRQALKLLLQKRVNDRYEILSSQAGESTKKLRKPRNRKRRQYLVDDSENVSDGEKKLEIVEKGEARTKKSLPEKEINGSREKMLENNNDLLAIGPSINSDDVYNSSVKFNHEKPTKHYRIDAVSNEIPNCLFEEDLALAEKSLPIKKFGCENSNYRCDASNDLSLDPRDLDVYDVESLTPSNSSIDSRLEMCDCSSLGDPDDGNTVSIAVAEKSPEKSDDGNSVSIRMTKKSPKKSEGGSSEDDSPSFEALSPQPQVSFTLDENFHAEFFINPENETVALSSSSPVKRSQFRIPHERKLVIDQTRDTTTIEVKEKRKEEEEIVQNENKITEETEKSEEEEKKVQNNETTIEEKEKIVQHENTAIEEKEKREEEEKIMQNENTAVEEKEKSEEEEKIVQNDETTIEEKERIVQHENTAIEEIEKSDEEEKIMENENAAVEEKEKSEEEEKKVQNNDTAIEEKEKIVQHENTTVEEKEKSEEEEKIMQNENAAVEEKEKSEEEEKMVQNDDTAIEEKEKMMHNENAAVEEKEKSEEEEKMVQNDDTTIEENDKIMQNENAAVEEKEKSEEEEKIVENENPAVEEKAKNKEDDKIVENGNPTVEEKEKNDEEDEKIVQDENPMVEETEKKDEENEKIGQNTNTIVEVENKIRTSDCTTVVEEKNERVDINKNKVADPTFKNVDSKEKNSSALENDKLSINLERRSTGAIKNGVECRPVSIKLVHINLSKIHEIAEKSLKRGKPDVEDKNSAAASTGKKHEKRTSLRTTDENSEESSTGDSSDNVEVRKIRKAKDAKIPERRSIRISAETKRDKVSAEALLTELPNIEERTMEKVKTPQMKISTIVNIKTSKLTSATEECGNSISDTESVEKLKSSPCQQPSPVKQIQINTPEEIDKSDKVFAKENAAPSPIKKAQKRGRPAKIVQANVEESTLSITKITDENVAPILNEPKNLDTRRKLVQSSKTMGGQRGAEQSPREAKIRDGSKSGETSLSGSDGKKDSSPLVSKKNGRLRESLDTLDDSEHEISTSEKNATKPSKEREENDNGEVNSGSDEQDGSMKNRAGTKNGAVRTCVILRNSKNSKIVLKEKHTQQKERTSASYLAYKKSPRKNQESARRFEFQQITFVPKVIAKGKQSEEEKETRNNDRIDSPRSERKNEISPRVRTKCRDRGLKPSVLSKKKLVDSIETNLTVKFKSPINENGETLVRSDSNESNEALSKRIRSEESEEEAKTRRKRKKSNTTSTEEDEETPRGNCRSVFHNSSNASKKTTGCTAASNTRLVEELIKNSRNSILHSDKKLMVVRLKRSEYRSMSRISKIDSVSDGRRSRRIHASKILAYMQMQIPKIVLKRLEDRSVKRLNTAKQSQGNKLERVSKNSRNSESPEFRLPSYDGPADFETSDNEEDPNVTIVSEEKRVCTYSNTKKTLSLAANGSSQKKRKLEPEEASSSRCLSKKRPSVDSTSRGDRTPKRPARPKTPLNSPSTKKQSYSPLKIVVTSPKVRSNRRNNGASPSTSRPSSTCPNSESPRLKLRDSVLRDKLSQRQLSSQQELGDQSAASPSIVRSNRADKSNEIGFIDQVEEEVMDTMRGHGKSIRKRLIFNDKNLSEETNKCKVYANPSLGQDQVDNEEKRRNEDLEILAEDTDESSDTLNETLTRVVDESETERSREEEEDEDDVCNVTFTQYINSQISRKDTVSPIIIGGESMEGKIFIMPKYKAPSRQRVLDTFETYGIPLCRNEEAFFSDPADMAKEKEIAQRMLRVPVKGLQNLGAFASSVEGVTGLARWRKMWLNEYNPSFVKSRDLVVKLAHSGNGRISLIPLHAPPTQRQVKHWLKARKYLEKKKDEKNVVPDQESPDLMKKSSGSSSKSELMREDLQIHDIAEKSKEPTVSSRDSNNSTVNSSFIDVLEKSALFRNHEASRHVGLTSGQIDFLSNSTRSNISKENLQNAKAIPRYQYLTIMCLEVHVATRQDLLPDAQHDQIAALFYSVQSDVPPTSSIKPLEHGVIVQADSEKYKNQTDYCYASRIPWSISFVENEKDLLEALVTLVKRLDPEILIGWELETLSWGYVFQRASRLGINLFNRISRIPSTQYKWEFQAPEIETLTEVKLPGRIVLDIWRIMRHEAALLSYSFESVMHHVLNERISCPSYKTLTAWWNDENNRLRFSRWRVVEHYSIRVLGVFRILDHLDVIGRTSELARLFGIQFYEVFSRGSQFRVESVMLRLAKPLNYVAVSPSAQQRASMRAMEALPLILEPESMFYTDPIIVLDFQSLYPSIIIAHNYCFSTCLGRIEHIGQPQPFEFGAYNLRVPKRTALSLQGRVNYAPCGVAYVKPEVRLGILPRMLTEILETRLMVKKAMKDHDPNDKTLQKALHSRQLGLKFLANVTYGYTAANFSGRMPCIEVGDSVISKSKETLERAIKLVESTPKWGARVIYGDTDSLFILTPGKSKADAFVIGHEIADAVTASNPSPIKLKFEKVLYPAILQTKKRYCGYMYETAEQETPTYLAKGIETVRRDGCPAVSKILEKSLRILFDTKDVSLVKKYVTRQMDKVLRSKVSIQDLTFAKEFRGLNGYRSKACVPALELTRRLMKKDPRAIPRTSERVRYVIVAGGPNEALIHCVRTPWELINDPGLRPNAIYYITRVIIPPLNRCFNLMGVDVNDWYREMPHRLTLDNPVGQPSDKQKLTIFQYFGTIVCVACGQPSNKGICTECLETPADTLVVIHEKLRHLDRAHNNVTAICQSCVGQTDAADCASLDCPVLYRRAQTRRELTQTFQLREVITNGNKLQF